MRFIKSLFSSDPREDIRSKLLELEIGSKAIELPQNIGYEDKFSLVTEIGSELIENGKLSGQLVGRKGWFLPQADKKLKQVWNEIEKGPINLEEISDLWGLNEKRVFIALNDYAETKEYEEPYFHREGMILYLNAYLQKSWFDALAAYDDEDTIEFDHVISNAKVKSETKKILREKAKEWLKDQSSTYILGDDGIIRRREDLNELVSKRVNKELEQGANEIKYVDLANKYGVSRKTIADILQDLVDSNKITDVTIYPLDEKIKPRI